MHKNKLEIMHEMIHKKMTIIQLIFSYFGNTICILLYDKNMTLLRNTSKFIVLYYIIIIIRT